MKNAFLHDDMKEEIYMDTPLGYQYNNPRKLVCKLERLLYGLKQSLQTKKILQGNEKL